MPYSIDTSAFLDAWVRYYPPDVFPGIWQQMDRAARSAGIVKSSDEVLRELSRKDDGAHDWIKAHAEMVIALDNEIERHVREIMSRYPRLVDSKKGRSGGDPFVHCSRSREKPHGDNRRKRNRQYTIPRIPDVCDDLGIRWLRMLDFFREQRWAL